MSWPFPNYYRPLMRSILWYRNYKGYSDSEIVTTLTAPPHRHPLSDVEGAFPEAMRAQYFGDSLRAAQSGQTFGEVWESCKESCFERAYGRAPSAREMDWAYTRPSASLGLMYEITVPGVEGYRMTPTVNVPWDAQLGQVQAMIEGWFLTGLQRPPPPNTVGTVINEGVKPNVRIVGGALVERVEPTLTAQRR